MRSMLNVKNGALMLLMAILPLGASAIVGKTNQKTIQQKADAINEIVRVDDWTFHKEFDGINIEYKFEDCHEGRLNRQSVIFFRFTNTTPQARTFKWNLEIYMDGECSNCHKIDRPEYQHELTLQAGESIAGSPTNAGDRALFVFHHWARLVPGMTETELTKFKFINMQTSVAK